MSAFYQTKIAEATSRVDPRDLGAIESAMRTAVGCLDHLSVKEFATLAREAWAAVLAEPAYYALAEMEGLC